MSGSVERRTVPGLLVISLCLLVLFSSLYATDVDVKVIANVSVKADSVSTAELRSVFLAESNSLKDGSHVEPVFERAGAVHEAFLRVFLEESAESLKSHYDSLVSAGKSSTPKSFDDDADVLAYVAKTRGAIGYVSAATNTEGVKVLAVTTEATKRSERILLTRVEPEYPETLRQLHIGGIVRLRVTVSPQGIVENATLLGGNPILGESAITAVKQWVYAPHASRTTNEVSLRFVP